VIGVIIIIIQMMMNWYLVFLANDVKIIEFVGMFEGVSWWLMIFLSRGGVRLGRSLIGYRGLWGVIILVWVDDEEKEFLVVVGVFFV
jgi:hypothetical protein